jgi:heat shock protein HslJ
MAALLRSALACLALAALASCSGNSTYAPPATPYTFTPSPAATPSPTGGASPGGTVTETDLIGKAYTSTAVKGHTLAPRTAVKVRFGPRTMSVTAGCNQMFGGYAIVDDILNWTGTPATTTKRCTPELTAQDQWLRTTFRRGLHISGDPTNEMTLSNATATITLSPNSG